MEHHHNSDPPFEDTYKNLLMNSTLIQSTLDTCLLDLPLIDLSGLGGTQEETATCQRSILAASKEWGFFQVVNHGVSKKILEDMREEQVRVFNEPFIKKMNDVFLDKRMSHGSYRWGTPSAMSLRQLSWSEAFHIPLTDISEFSSITREFATRVSKLAHELARILAEGLGNESTFFEENCWASTCYVRMNRYPACPNYGNVYGLMPHTDSDFLTILYQDNVGGLQLFKDGRWIAVKPNPDALIVNIGDLFQAWSNGVYKSVEHRVVANQKLERFSTAFFLCPSQDVVIQSYTEPSIYKRFSFREYRQQVQDDVKTFGYKIGLSRFLTCN